VVKGKRKREQASKQASKEHRNNHSLIYSLSLSLPLSYAKIFPPPKSGNRIRSVFFSLSLDCSYVSFFFFLFGKKIIGKLIDGAKRREGTGTGTGGRRFLKKKKKKKAWLRWGMGHEVKVVAQESESMADGPKPSERASEKKTK